MTTIFRRKVRKRWALGLAMALFLGAPACNDGARDSEGDRAPGERELPGGSVTLWTEKTELFMEFPALLVEEPAKLLVHLTALSDFAPLRSGEIVLRFERKGGGEVVEVVQEAPRSPGIYGPVVQLPQPGSWDLQLSIESPQLEDTIRVSDLPVQARREALPQVGAGPDDGISFLKEQQWKSPGFRTAFAEAGSLPASIEVPGEIIPAAGRYAEVNAPVAGFVEPEGASMAPAPGQAVERGQVLAILMPALGESGSALAAARAELREAEQDHARAQRLFAVEAVPERRAQEARIRLDAARETLAGLTGGGTLSANGRVTLRAPIAGVVAHRELAPGSRVEAGAPLFTVVDPSLVWLRAHVPAAQAPRLRADAGASFVLEGAERSAETNRTVAVGSMVDPGTRTIPVLFEVENSDGAIKVGAHARVSLRTGEVEEGILIPDSAVLEEDGSSVAYIQAEGERFERRELALGPRAAERVLVRSGIEAGERVVTGAAYQVRLASLSTAVPAHGHAH